jgi:hypothetical protein
MKASEYLEVADRSGQFVFDLADSGKAPAKADSGRPAQPKCKSGLKVAEEPRRKTGRPKGSRTYGLTALRKVHSKVFLSDGLMGERCGVENCAVRLKVRYCTHCTQTVE